MRRTLTAVTLIGLAGAAWFVIRRSTDVSLPEPTVAVGLRADCAAVDSADYFFPPQIFRPWAGSPDDAARVYYGLFLKAMEEPSLSCE